MAHSILLLIFYVYYIHGAQHCVMGTFLFFFFKIILNASLRIGSMQVPDRHTTTDGLTYAVRTPTATAPIKSTTNPDFRITSKANKSRAVMTHY